MSISNISPIKVQLERFPLLNKPKFVVTQKLQDQIDYLHQQLGHTEWSGELITREEGKITDLDNWTIRGEDIYLVDVGSPGYTSYEVDKGAFTAVDVIELFDAFPQLIEQEGYKAQHCHSHHAMQTFFSGTDWSNLHERAMESNYFLMLIVNIKGDHIAKVAFRSKKSESNFSLNFYHNMDGYIPLALDKGPEKEVLVVMDCEMVFERRDTVEQMFIDRFQKVKSVPVYTAPKLPAPISIISPAGGHKYPNSQTRKLSKRERREERKRLAAEEKSKKDGTYWTKGWEQGEMGFPEQNKETKGPTKGIMSMTDAEYDAYMLKEYGSTDSPKTNNSNKSSFFDLRHARMVLNYSFNFRPNAALGPNWYNFADPIQDIIIMEKKMLAADDIKNAIAELEVDIENWFDEAYPEHSNEVEFIQLMEQIGMLLMPSKYNRLVHEILDLVEYMKSIAEEDLLETTEDEPEKAQFPNYRPQFD